MGGDERRDGKLRVMEGATRRIVGVDQRDRDRRLLHLLDLGWQLGVVLLLLRLVVVGEDDDSRWVQAARTICCLYRFFDVGKVGLNQKCQHST